MWTKDIRVDYKPDVMKNNYEESTLLLNIINSQAFKLAHTYVFTSKQVS